jgi:hypothetical protein
MYVMEMPITQPSNQFTQAKASRIPNSSLMLMADTHKSERQKKQTKSTQDQNI